MTIAVVYLARGEGNGIVAARQFFESYKERFAGADHNFYVICKGWTDNNEETELRNLAKACDAAILDQADDGFDWGAYFRAAKCISENYVIFLNSHSKIVGDNWLGKLVFGISQKSIGIVGVTGSFSSWVDWTACPPFSFWSGLVYPLHLLRNIGNCLAHRGKYAPFPNIHLRSNAFIIRTDLFNEFARRMVIPRKKSDAHELESGLVGLSNFIRSKNLEIYICDISGHLLPPQQWSLGQFFRAGSQKNLLIEDNQTNAYREANIAKKHFLEYKSWHKIFR
jgi:hypothetical protein